MVEKAREEMEKRMMANKHLNACFCFFFIFFLPSTMMTTTGMTMTTMMMVLKKFE